MKDNTMYEHLSYDMIGAHLAGVKDHPQKVMKDLGIGYEKSVPQSIADSWQFFNVTNLPENLPSYLEAVDYEPLDYIGFGLSEDDARKLSKLNPVEADNFVLNKQLNRELEDERCRNRAKGSSKGKVFNYDTEDVVLTFGDIEIKSWGPDVIPCEGGNTND